ncbi:MAG: hypothetical protein JSS02_15855 [Planctomycetes bacterium]|nr:hypothetical protein [Planctomycetota bacterium]
MGAWGPAIFSDDVAADTRDAFTDFIAEGLTPTAATDRLIGESAEILENDDEALVFWLSLAATQWKLGRLVDQVRDRAIEIIESGADLKRWGDNTRAEQTQRKKHLEKLRQQLLSPPPAPKKVKALRKSSTDFQPGDVVTFCLDNVTSVRFCVVHLWGDRGGTYADICLLGLDDGQPFTKTSLALEDTLGPHYTLLSHEPAEGITVLRRGVALPDRTPELFRAWNQLTIRGHACSWDDFPAALRETLPKLGWR